MASAAMHTYSDKKCEPFIDPQDARTFSVQFKPSTTIARGTILGQVAASGKFAPYASGNSDGTQTPRAIAMYDMVVDANGKIAFGTGTLPIGDQGQLYANAPVYYKGVFNVSDLNGLDAAAVTALGRMLTGTYAAGILEVQ